MRALVLLLALCAMPAHAADLPVTSRVSAVTLYPSGATVTREARIALPAGRHDLILTDLPRDTPLETVRVTLDGARLGGVTTRRDRVPPRETEESAAIEAARAEVARREAALRAGRAGVDDIRLEAEAARARLRFLDGLARRDGLAAQDPDRLGDLVALIGRETLDARRAETGAERRADDALRALEDLEADLARARDSLAALVPETGPRALLAVTVDAAADTEARLAISYSVPEAGWQPLYDLHLARATGGLRIERGAYLQQATGESWRDIALTLATTRPSGQGAPAEIHPWIPRLVDPDEIRPLPRARSGAALMEMATPADAAPVMAAPDFDGLSVRYAYPAPVSVATGADRVRLMLPPVETETRITARAVPLLDETAFLIARLTNAPDDVLLPTPEARFYLDGRYTGQRPLPLIPAGGAADLAFGPIDGLTLARVVRIRGQGERGLLARATERRETVEITVENLTGEAWPIDLRDRVPVSEDDALRITWSADPPPAETGLEGGRGLLAWRFDLPAQAVRSITLDTVMSWPDGKLLR